MLEITVKKLCQPSKSKIFMSTPLVWPNSKLTKQSKIKKKIKKNNNNWLSSIDNMMNKKLKKWCLNLSRPSKRTSKAQRMLKKKKMPRRTSMLLFLAMYRQTLFNQLLDKFLFNTRSRKCKFLQKQDRKGKKKSTRSTQIWAKAIKKKLKMTLMININPKF